jgi:hypothetical protein
VAINAQISSLLIFDVVEELVFGRLLFGHLFPEALGEDEGALAPVDGLGGGALVQDILQAGDLDVRLLQSLLYVVQQETAVRVHPPVLREEAVQEALEGARLAVAQFLADQDLVHGPHADRRGSVARLDERQVGVEILTSESPSEDRDEEGQHENGVF